MLTVAFQAASADTSLYFFRKNSGEKIISVEAVQEEKISGFIKLTTADGKAAAWQENMLVGKIGLIDDSAPVPDQASLEAYVASLEAFMAKEPETSSYLKPLVDKWKAQIFRAKVEVADTSHKLAEEKLAKFLAEPYRPEQNYAVEILESKASQGAELAVSLPDQSGKISEYLKPWAEELKNRKAGLERFEGSWMSTADIARIKTERVEAVRKSFLEKELAFNITGSAISQNTVYIALGFLGLSALFLISLLFGGVKGLFQKPGPMTWFALGIGGGGLAAYAFAAWLLMQPPAGYSQGTVTLERASGDDPQGTLALDDLIFRIHQPAGSNAAEAPSELLIQDPALNAFLKNYVKIESSAEPQSHAVVRKGMKVEVKADRILIFDEMNWVGRDLVVCYTIYFSKTADGFQFGKTEACAGALPLPGKVFTHLWSQMGPLMGDVLARSKVLETYYIKRMEFGVVEMVSTKAANKQASRTIKPTSGGG